MKDFSLRELSQQYAAGELNSAQYREMRHALLDRITANNDENGSFPDCPPASIPPADSDSQVSFSAKALFLWFCAVVFTVILLFIAWNLPDENEKKNIDHPQATSDYILLNEKMRQSGEVTVDNEDTSSLDTFQEIPVLPNTKYKDVKNQKMKINSRESGR